MSIAGITKGEWIAKTSQGNESNFSRSNNASIRTHWSNKITPTITGKVPSQPNTNTYALWNTQVIPILIACAPSASNIPKDLQKTHMYPTCRKTTPYETRPRRSTTTNRPNTRKMMFWHLDLRCQFSTMGSACLWIVTTSKDPNSQITVRSLWRKALRSGNKASHCKKVCMKKFLTGGIRFSIMKDRLSLMGLSRILSSDYFLTIFPFLSLSSKINLTIQK